MIKIKLNSDFNLDNTVTCGQIFRFYKLDDESYDIILKDRVINAYKKDNLLFVSSNNELNLKEVVTQYFDLENNYEQMMENIISKDYKIKNAATFSKGLKMIKQDPFETIIEYIISANNGVGQIANSINNISKKYGKKVMFKGKEYYLFPRPRDLTDVTTDILRSCKVGFRDKYIKAIIDKINNNEINIDAFYELDTKTAMDKLMENPGIGPKVASCILLFGYQKYDVFPIDTWVKKIMEKEYEIKGEQNIRKYANNTYGKYSGIAIQYLFNYARNNGGVK